MSISNIKIGAKHIVDRLIKHNIKNVFGVSGGAILPVLNEFYKHNKINYIQTRTELGASFMAEGYAKATRQPGVVMVTSGPGAINTMTSLQNALSDGTPILALTGQVSTTVIGTDAFQEADVIGISKPCTKWNYIIKDGSIIDSVIDNAFLSMLNKRHGPVLIDLPKNIMSANAEQKELKVSEIIQEKTWNISTKKIYELIINSKKPVILCGQGVLQAGAEELLRIFATRTSIPVTTTLMGLGCFPEKNTQSLKMLGMHGSYYANMAIQNCDLLINFGSRFDDRIIGDPTKFAPKAKIVHIDIESKNINKVIKTPYYINDNCKTVLEQLNYYAYNYIEYDICKYKDWYIQINEWKKINFSYPKKQVLQGRQVIKLLNNIIKNDIQNKYTIVADVGAHQMWAAQFIDYDYPKIKWLTSGGLGSMGYALPASIGVKIGLPNEKVICICGDGGFTMSFVEILTAVENKINIKVLIINNSYQLMVKMWQEKFYNNQLIGVKMNNPPFEEICKSMGSHGIKIDFNSTNEDVITKLKYVLDYEDGPIICNIITDENECVLPMVSPGKALDDMIIDEDNKDVYTGDAPC
jgi:acetolactate synthase-1/2/3 large subunit